MASFVVLRQTTVVLLVSVLTASVDQASKIWAWRHTAAHVNSGGDMLVNSDVSQWYRDPIRGAMLDCLGVAALMCIGLLLVRRRRAAAVLWGGAAALAGWVSNLADRLGMHRITAPGSTRGAVDFLPFAGHIWNLADLATALGTMCLAIGASSEALRRVRTWADRTAPLVVKLDLVGKSLSRPVERTAVLAAEPTARTRQATPAGQAVLRRRCQPLSARRTRRPSCTPRTGRS